MTWAVYEEYQKRRAALRRHLTEEAIKHPRDPAQPAKPIVDSARGEVKDWTLTPEEKGKNAQVRR